ncbi:MAG: hypothetical protein LKF96_00045 [Treponema sp.]|jgi:hypothetical protein|nr:hypothetical protein [Treponema sp.]
MKIKTILLSVAAAGLFTVSAQSHISTQAHQSRVTMLATQLQNGRSGNSFFSAGLDGFLIKWTEDGLGEHYQISDIGIQMIACSPNGTDIAVYETDGGSVNRVSVWNWQTLRRIYAKRFMDSVTSLSFSEKGTYLMVGTASVDGVVFLNAKTGRVTNVMNEATGIVSLVRSSSSEKTAVMYSPAGSITYYYLNNGRKKARFTTIQGLLSPVLFNNNVYLAGIKDDSICIIQSVTGKTIATIPAQSPLLLVSKTDKDLYYLEYTGKYYVLKVIKNLDNQSVANPVIVKTFNGPRDRKDSICSGAKIGNVIVLGAQDGAVYKIDADPDTQVLSLYALTDQMYDKIFDMAPAGDDFYFLTRNAIFKSSYDSGIVDKILKDPDRTNILTYHDSAILWSKNTNKSVLLADFTTGTVRTVFTPEKNIQILRVFNDTLIDIEANAVVNSISIDTGTVKKLYEGAGLQDAVLYNNTNLYVAKSSATNPKSALLYVNTVTMETVPISINGTVAYSLCYDETKENSSIYGIILSTDRNTTTTSLFSFLPSTKYTQAILKLSDEDPEAFALLDYPLIYTNIGKNQVRSFNLVTRKDFLYKRSASLPLKVTRSNSRIVVLNRDGSISWYNPNLSTVLSDWYLTTDGQWFEF